MIDVKLDTTHPFDPQQLAVNVAETTVASILGTQTTADMPGMITLTVMEVELLKLTGNRHHVTKRTSCVAKLADRWCHL